MAKQVLTGQFLALNGTNIHTMGTLKKASLTVEVEEQDVTNHGSGGSKEFLGGLRSGSLSIEGFQDFAASNIDATMWPLLGTVVTFELRATTGSVSATNPKYTGSVLVKSWQPLDGSVGEVAVWSVDYPTSGAIARATS